MRTRPTPLLLLARALTAAITVWCLGCAEYDPIIKAVLGDGASAMRCASEMMQQSGTDAGQNTAASFETSGAQDGLTCGCASCHSASPQSVVVVAERAPAPSAEPSSFAAPVSVVRAPNAPPPELHTL